MSKTDNTPRYPSVKAAETAFYEAFANCDVQAMAAVWSSKQASCIHPGSVLLSGYDKVMQSWQMIFHNAIPPQLNITVLNTYHAENIAVHIVEERITADEDKNISIVLATNVYQFESGQWQLCIHHASVPVALQAASGSGSKHEIGQVH